MFWSTSGEYLMICLVADILYIYIYIYINKLQKGIEENWEAALEHNPEAFARVVWCILVMTLF